MCPRCNYYMRINIDAAATKSHNRFSKHVDALRREASTSRTSQRDTRTRRGIAESYTQQKSHSHTHSSEQRVCSHYIYLSPLWLAVDDCVVLCVVCERLCLALGNATATRRRRASVVTRTPRSHSAHITFNSDRDRSSILSPRVAKSPPPSFNLF